MVKRFGTFQGVFVPSYEALLGAVLFVILPGLVWKMGLWQMLIIVALANTVTLATAFSIGDCTTNLERVGAGGMYAISKRSLGRAFGGSIGIQLFLAQAVSIGFYVLAFADPLQKLIIQIPIVADLVDQFNLSILMQKQIAGTILALIAFIAGLIGANFVIKIQMVIFIILTCSVASIFISPFFDFNPNVARIFNLTPNTDGFLNIGFWTAFAIFFPAVTGIDAGLGMSGNLKSPRKSLSGGTFIAIAITALVYLGVTVVFSFIRPELFVTTGSQSPNAVDIFSHVPIIPWLLLTGVLFATGSSALAYFMTAPRTAQALGKDRILPRFMLFLGSDFSKRGSEPRWATVLTVIIVVIAIWLGDVEFASMVVGICFLVVYGWVNLAAFFERVSGNPSFRPTSKGHWAISLYGFVMCMFVISMFNIWVGIAVIASQLLIFFLLLKFKTHNRLEGVWWGLLFNMLNWGFSRMRRIIQGSKNWRPIVGIFCMADKREETETTFKMGRRISNYQGLTMINLLKPGEAGEPDYPLPVGAKVVQMPDDDYDKAIISMLQGAAPGGLEINTVLLSLDARINKIELIENIIDMRKEVLLYKHGLVQERETRCIDIWWKGEENGNLMALLAYIISRNERERGKPEWTIRIIRKLFKGEDKEKSQQEMEALLYSARLRGEILILEDDNEPLHKSIAQHSQQASLIMMGMPGEKPKGIARLFSLDKIFFTKALERFKELPPVLFVKAHMVIELFE